MKRIILLLATALFLTSCAQSETTQDDNIKQINKGDKEEMTEDEVQKEEDKMLESIEIGGVILEINENMILVEVMDGIAEKQVVLKISDETVWDAPQDLMSEAQYIRAEISPVMTRSIPPQTNAVRIISLNDIILGEVVEITDTQITLKPVNFHNHETVIVNISDETQWNVEQGSVSVGHNIRVMVGMQMTMSIPPQVAGIKVLSIETHD